jgi:hypothetical protein
MLSFRRSTGSVKNLKRSLNILTIQGKSTSSPPIEPFPEKIGVEALIKFYSSYGNLKEYRDRNFVRIFSATHITIVGNYQIRASKLW